MPTYVGTAIGSVSNDGIITTGLTGNFSATVDFGSGTGSLQIERFAGRTFGDTQLDINRMMSGMPDGSFSGSLEMNGNTGFYGEYPAAAMLGGFKGDDGTWSASGVFAAGKTGQTPLTGDLAFGRA